jgi:nucleoside-triphosphatase
MAEAVLLTGAPGSGKTTLLKRVLTHLSGQAGGFYTEEIRERGQRTGFKLVTLEGRQGILAHVDIDSSLRIGQYGLDLSVLETLGVQSLQQAMREGWVVILDEIGPMEIKSKVFCVAVLEILESNATVLGTIHQRDVPFTRAIKTRPGVSVFTVTRANREALFQQALETLSRLGSTSARSL